MSFGDPKLASNTIEKISDTNGEPVELRTITGSTGFNEALIKEPVSLANATTIKLMLCLLLGCFCQTMNGYDGSLFGGLTSNKTFLSFFHGTNNGEWAAFNSAMYQIGGVCALPFVGPLVDTWGRKVGMSIGAWLIILGTIINGTTLYDADVGQLKGGRFLLGFGVSIVSAAGPIYVVETAHPAWRGVLTAYCNTFWFTGSILASGAVRGGLNLVGNMSWQIPVWLQMVFPGIIALFVWLIPESPRWLFVHNKREAAKDTLIKWHGQGNVDSAWVRLQLAEYEEFLNTDGADKRFWDYRALFRNRASRYRIACNVIFSIFAQWAGNGVLTYFLPAVLTVAGYSDSITQANINLAYACFQFFFALVGAAFVERLGRRKLMLFSMGACCLVWVGMTVASGLFAQSDQTNSSAAKATVAMIFIFGACFSIGITPLQALYPVEVLSFEMRAKGMAFSSLAVNAGGLLNQFAWPISLARIGWHTYIIFIVWDAIQWLVFYFIMPETRRRTLEELDEIFNSKRPVKTSLVPRKVEVDTAGSIIAAEPLEAKV
ncbi:hypothetical protein BAUCODRAFT_152390 [Baudoinia panamericana UAMH 10762]|uniref:Major facilitator superfamily (MFS) profile domain-containing protein n=1 Tax=Baudoinia panamericana (strain UAMH 10762) TaxID=717646 RepID=M2M3I2_BAUPA|nr:uncharacterized protein BAUCODRAFT_152390 [Baudoinia panamericana UAMH 10762]EMC91096.1 hypothetical protein BAUCODRAFT_152390 [Baudoinia panamericana UAMH 10762]